MPPPGEAARRRAHELLVSHLEDHEYTQLIVQQFLDVVSPSNSRRVYRIFAQPDKVSVIEDGLEVERLCVQTEGTLPDDDMILLHTVLILGDEQWYLETAQHWPPRTAFSSS